MKITIKIIVITTYWVILSLNNLVFCQDKRNSETHPLYFHFLREMMLAKARAEALDLYGISNISKSDTIFFINSSYFHFQTSGVIIYKNNGNYSGG